MIINFMQKGIGLFVKHPLVVIALAVYLYSIWSFLIGENYFSSDFLQLHLVFEHAYRSLDNNLLSTSWLPVFQGGKSVFGADANSFSPFGIDFIFTYAVTKILFLDKLVGLLIIDTWRLALLNIVFAVGCRQLAKELLETSRTADFVFLITLFVGAYFLLHQPIYVTANVFTPWVLVYLTRVAVSESGRLLHNAAGLTLATAASVFHQFNTQISFIWPYILLYTLSLVFFGFCGPFLSALKSQWHSWKTKGVLLLLTIAVAISVLPLAWSFTMAFDHLVDPTNLNLLIHSDTMDGSEEFSDSSKKNHTVRTHGGVHHSTNTKTIGESSIYFDGEDDFLSIESSPHWDLSNQPFTIDMWVYPTRTQAGSGILSLDGTNGAPGGILFGYEDGSSTYKLFMSSTGTRWDIESGSDAGEIALFRWQHLAITRSNDSLRAFVNGTIAGTWDTKDALYAPESSLTIGKSGGFFQGYIDEIRVSIGDAHWTSQFTPPLMAYEPSDVGGKTSQIYDGDFRFFGIFWKFRNFSESVQGIG